MELGYFLINGLGGPFACHMGHIGLGPHPKSKHALKCISYGVVCGMFYSVENEKVLISEDDHQKRKLHVELHKLVVETHLRRFLNVFFP